MFLHIPLQEINNIMQPGKFEEEMNEVASCSVMNSGLLLQLFERGDVKGIFAGHDHINNFVGDWYGIKLGFSGSIGYTGYGLKGTNDAEVNRLRGARIFMINENEPETFTTKYVTADSIK